MTRVRLVAVAALVAAAALVPVRPGQAAPALPWLHVAHPRGALPVITDASGRTVVLRGANASGFEDDWYRTPDGVQRVAPFWPIDPADYADGRCPANSHLISEPALCEHDFAQMHALGFNMVRLTLSWSALEPSPWHYDRTYLARILQVVGWAAAQGVYVLLDMHQDAYSRFIPDTSAVQVPPLLTTTPGSGNHADGAPPWAIITDGEPSVGAFGVGETNLMMNAAFTSFWLNRGRLQDHYIGAMAFVARAVRNNPAVAGYEIMNEPLAGTIQDPAFSAAFLYPFYRRVVRGLTGAAGGDRRHLVFFEPYALRNLLDASPDVSAPWTTYPNIVYAPHVYTHVFTVDTQEPAGVPRPYPVSYDQAFQTASIEARALRAALFIGEFGNGANSDDTQLAAETAALDRHTASSAVWAWKGNCDPGAPASGCPDSWSTFYGDPADPPANSLDVKPTRLKYLSRVYPRATAGRLESFGYDPGDQSFTMTAVAARRGGSPTVVYIPAGVAGVVSVDGAARLTRVTTDADGSRLAYVTPTNRGRYTVDVS